MQEVGVTRFIEIGPGKVCLDLSKRLIKLLNLQMWKIKQVYKNLRKLDQMVEVLKGEK